MSRRKKRRRRDKSAGFAPDPRIIAAQITEPFVGPSGRMHDAGAWATVISPLRLADDRVVMFPGAQVTALYLTQARSGLRPDQSDRGDTYRAAGLEGTALDAVAYLAAAVLLAFASIEEFCNSSISHPEAPAVLAVERYGDRVAIPADEYARRLSTAEKLDLVVPAVSGRPSIKGTGAWEKFVRLRRLRDDLVHVKHRGYSADPDDPSALGRLLRGDGSGCVEDAVTVIRAALPGWLTERALRQLSLHG